MHLFILEVLRIPFHLPIKNSYLSLSATDEILPWSTVVHFWFDRNTRARHWCVWRHLPRTWSWCCGYLRCGGKFGMYVPPVHMSCWFTNHTPHHFSGYGELPVRQGSSDHWENAKDKNTVICLTISEIKLKTEIINHWMVRNTRHF